MEKYRKAYGTSEVHLKGQTYAQVRLITEKSLSSSHPQAKERKVKTLVIGKRTRMQALQNPTKNCEFKLLSGSGFQVEVRRS